MHKSEQLVLLNYFAFFLNLRISITHSIQVNIKTYRQILETGECFSKSNSLMTVYSAGISPIITLLTITEALSTRPWIITTVDISDNPINKTADFLRFKKNCPKPGNAKADNKSALVFNVINFSDFKHENKDFIEFNFLCIDLCL